MSSLTPRERIDGWRAFVDETKNTFEDYFIDKTVTNPRPQERFSTHKRGREFQSGLELLRRTESLLMSVGDRNVWKKAYVNAVAELQRVNDMNIQNGQRGMTQEELLDLAESEANYATFNEDSNLADILNQMKQDPHWGFLVDYVVPFTGVTTNVTKRMLQYSPFGLVGTVVKVARDAHMGENFDQRAFVQGLSRGLSSFGMIAVGALLKSLGLIKIGYKDEEDSKAKGLRKAMGEQYTPYLQLGDKNINLSAFNPASAAFVMGAAWHEEAQKIDGSLGDGMLNMLFSAGDMIFDSSYMTSLKDALGGSGYGGEGFTQNFANTLISSMASQPVPALVQQTAKAFDPYVHDTKDSNTLIQTAKELLNKIPFARELLPKSIDVMGKEEFNDAQGAWNYVQPLNIKQQDNEPAAVEILRLEDVLGGSTHIPSDALSGGKTTLKFSGKSYIVAGDDKQFYRERYGTLWLNGGTTYDKDGAVVMVTGVADLIQTEEYKAASDKDKANMIKAIVSQAKTGASYEVVMRISPTE